LCGEAENGRLYLGVSVYFIVIANKYDL